MFAKFNILSARRKRFSPWWFGLKLGMIGAIVVWWWLQEQEQEKPKTVEIKRVVLPDDDVEPAAPEPEKPKAKAKPKTVEPDDLTAIDGIGPKYAAVLNEAGVATFAQLAKMDANPIRNIFRDAVGRAPDPTGWIEQAKDKSG